MGASSVCGNRGKENQFLNRGRREQMGRISRQTPGKETGRNLGQEEETHAFKSEPYEYIKFR